MTGKQGAAEWLRGMIDEYKANDLSCTEKAKMFGIDCNHEESCIDCEIDKMRVVADRIDAERELPEGVEWPRFEDGEPVNFGSKYVDDDGGIRTVTHIELTCGGIAMLRCCGLSELKLLRGERVKRPAPEVLGADGAPIEVGDTVYCDDDPEPWQVDLIYAGSMGYCTVRLKNNTKIYKSADAPRLSHKKPEPADSWILWGEDLDMAVKAGEVDKVEMMRRAKALAKADSEARGVE